MLCLPTAVAEKLACEISATAAFYTRPVLIGLQIVLNPAANVLIICIYCVPNNNNNNNNSFRTSLTT
jgi:hypothetical protein